MRRKITLALLFILAISLIHTSFVLAQQPQKPSATQTAPASISAKAASGFGLSFQANYTFSSRNLTINGDVFKCANIEVLVTYNIDGSENYTLPTKITFPYRSSLIPLAYINGSVVLPLLSVGRHSITVYGKWTAIISSIQDEIELAQATLSFAVRSPVISVLSPENTSYYSKDLPVNFTTDEPVSWIGYSLDNQRNVTTVGNFSIVNMTYGSHNVTVYANSTFGVLGASENVSFTIARPFPIVTIAVISIIVGVAVVAGLFVYFKKHRHQK